LPVVAETWDGYLNDTNGFHVKPEDAFNALDTAHTGAVEEGNVGGGSGMICNEFKGGIGTASRVLDAKHSGYTVGVLVQCNYGQRDQLRIAGVPVGREIGGPKVWDDDVGFRHCGNWKNYRGTASRRPSCPHESAGAGFVDQVL
jgi:L-aminopeptidase/D-esterase-like protein